MKSVLNGLRRLALGAAAAGLVVDDVVVVEVVVSIEAAERFSFSRA
jgi:hypothetical protein